MTNKADPTPLFIVLDMDTATGIPEAHACATGKEADATIMDLITDEWPIEEDDMEEINERFLLVIPKEIYRVDMRRILSVGIKTRIDNATALRRATGLRPERRK